MTILICVGDGKGNEIPSLNTWISDQVQIPKSNKCHVQKNH